MNSKLLGQSRMKRRTVWKLTAVGLVLSVWIAGCLHGGYRRTPSAAGATLPAVDYSSQIRPIFETHCYTCHGGKKKKGGLQLDKKTFALRGGDSGEAAIVPGSSGESLLVKAVTIEDSDEFSFMPLDDDPLNAEQIALLRRWIDEGAAWTESAAAQKEEVSTKDIQPERTDEEILTGLTTIAGAEKEISYNRDVRPIFSENCFKCHGPSTKNGKGDLRLDIRDKATAKQPAENGDGTFIIPRDSQNSLVIKAVKRVGADVPMPPKKTSKVLTPEQIDLLSRWIDAGAKYEKHWSLIPPTRPKPPNVNGAKSASSAIDAFILERMKGTFDGISSPTDKRTLIRRVTLDLTGLPPTIAEVDRFLQDMRPDAYERLVDRLLASPHYGERMAQDWLDAARYGDTMGYEEDAGRTMWLFRDWVINAYNKNMPFDQFTIEQLAGDMLPNATVEQKIASGFHRNSMQAAGNNLTKEEFRVKGLFDRIDTNGRVWLGITTACIQCHDHKYDPYTQKDYYRMYALFNNIPHFGADNGKGVHGPLMNVVPPGTKVEGAITDEERLKLQKDIYTAIKSDKDSTSIAHWDFGGNIKDTGSQPAALSSSSSDPKFSDEHPYGTGKSLYLEKQAWVQAEKNEKLDITGDFFISAWIKTGQPYGTIASKYDFRASDTRSFYFGIGGESFTPPGTLSAWLSSSATAFKGIQIFTEKLLNDNKWHHVAFEYVAGKSVRLFVDGIEDKKATRKGDVPTSIAVSSRNLAIGAGYTRSEIPNNSFFTGHIADLRIGKNAAWFNNEALQLAGEKLNELNTGEEITVQAQIMEEGPPRDTHIFIRGEFTNKGEKVEPGAPAVFGLTPQKQPKDRLDFARWLVDRKHPLTSRVTINRLWYKFFGTGLVSTLEDFGAQGEYPVNPDLLNWLAVEFMESGWDVKHMSKLIVLSNTYRQRSAMSKEQLALDQYNRLLSTFPRVRLPAEQIRDLYLSVSGQLNKKIGGPSVYPPQPAGLWTDKGALKGKWITSIGDDQYRRGLYIFWKRTILYPGLLLFDAPTRERCKLKRSISNTPLQALVTLNDPVFVELARVFAENLLKSEKINNDNERIDIAFQQVLARPPDTYEKREFLKFYQQQLTYYSSEKELAAVLSKTGSASPVQDLPVEKVAAWTMVTSTLLNMDEAITRN